MSIEQQISIVEDLLEAVKELNRELNGIYNKGDWWEEIENGDKLLKHLKMIDKDRETSIKKQISPLEWVYYPYNRNPLMGIDNWCAYSSIGQLSIIINNGCYVLRAKSENGNDILEGFGSLEEAKNEAQERHNNAVMQFFVS